MLNNMQEICETGSRPSAEAAGWTRSTGLRVTSLFSGAGGLDIGFGSAGHQIVWANDIDPDSVETYRHNIGDHIVLGDIADIAPGAIPQHDILVGGFPCQGFSRANVHKVKFDDRNNLYSHIVRHLRHHEPKFFLLENVRGIVSLGKGEVFKQIVHELESIGYVVQYKVLNAADYGVPQNRIRVIISGIRKDLSSNYRYVFPEPTHGRKGTADGKKSWVTISAALEGIPEPDEPHNLTNHICSKYKVTNRDFTGHRQTDGSKPSPTILARGNGGGGVCAIQHPNNHRRLSVRESALIQTFPREFVFMGKMNSMYRQIGNAVPCELAAKLAQGFQERNDEF